MVHQPRADVCLSPPGSPNSRGSGAWPGR